MTAKAAADLCTLARLALAPVFAWTAAGAAGSPSPVPLLVYGVAAVTDVLDGRLARAGGTDSRAGRLFDHGADAAFLFPALAVLAAAGRVPALLPLAASLAFALYLLDGWRRGGGLAAIDLLPSDFGAAAGVLNYAVAGFAAGALWLGATPLDPALRVAALVATAVNLAAVVERVHLLLAAAPAARLER
jgi:phosphatidylglycerophosphate synthase